MRVPLAGGSQLAARVSQRDQVQSLAGGISVLAWLPAGPAGSAVALCSSGECSDGLAEGLHRIVMARARAVAAALRQLM